MQSEITERAKRAWNNISDEHNQWDALSLDERQTYIALTAALSDKQAGEVKNSEWHRTDRPGGGSVMLYTLREEGRRRGEPVMTNDVMINIDRGTGSSTDIEPIVQRIRSDLVDAPVEPVALIEREVLTELAKHKTATGTVCSPLLKSKFGDKVPLYASPHREGEDSAEVDRIIADLRHAASGLADRLQQTHAIDNAIAFLAATRSASAITATGNEEA